MKHALTLLLLLALPAIASAQSQAPGIHELESRDHAARGSVPSHGSETTMSPFRDSPSSLVTRSTALAKRVFGWVPYWISAAEWARFDWSALTAIGYFSLEADTNGRTKSLRGWPAPALRDTAHAHGVKFILTVTSFGTAANTALLGSPAHRSTLVGTIVDAVVSGGGDGVNIDFESVPVAQRDRLTAFMRELATAVRAAVPGAEISMAIPAVDWGPAFDVAALGEACDYLIMMGYDYHWRTSPTAGPVAPLAGESWNVTRSVQTYLAAGLPAAKLMLGVPWYGYEWLTADSSRGAAALGSGRPVLYVEAKNAAEANGRMFDAATSTPWYRFTLDDRWYQTWYDDSLSLALKYRFANESALGGIGIWALGYQGDAVDAWQGIHQAFDLPMAVDDVRRERLGLAIIPHRDRLELRMPRRGALRVELVDPLGRHVATLADGAFDAGVHVVRIDPADIPAGIYFVRADDVAVRYVRVR